MKRIDGRTVLEAWMWENKVRDKDFAEWLSITPSYFNKIKHGNRLATPQIAQISQRTGIPAEDLVKANVRDLSAERIK